VDRADYRAGDMAQNLFALLAPDDQRRAIQRMARQGMGDHIIAAATGLHVQQVRAILSERGSVPL
jgi:hypothetical protein